VSAYPADALPLPAYHDLGQSYLFLDVSEGGVAGRWEANVSDLNRALGLNFDTEGGVTLEDVSAHIDTIYAYFEERMGVYIDQTRYPIRYVRHELRVIEVAQFVMLYFEVEGLEEEPPEIDLSYNAFFDFDSRHRGLLVVEYHWKSGSFGAEIVSLTFSPDRTRQTLDLSASIWQGLWSVILLGIWHIWIGIDHILFLIALILPAVVRREDGEWKPVARFRPALMYIVKIVTLFTIAHSVTLSLATLGLVELPSRLVESIIAASIAVAALDILYPVFRNQIWMVVFGFGLFHGFGFASVLGDLGVTREHLALSLFGFNLGVELGQITVICLAFPVLYALRSTRLYLRWVLRLGPVLLMLIALMWFSERALNFNIPVIRLAKEALALVGLR
jgi:hypothetical protein